MGKTIYQWPEWMGYPKVDGYGLQVVDRRVSTEMEVGSIKRVEFDTDESIVSCILLCDQLQAGFFETFERDLTSQGTKPFAIKLWLGGQLVEQTARFRERPQLTGKFGAYSEYSFSLDIAERKGLMSADEAELLLVFGPDFIRAASDRLQHILHVEAPRVTNTPANIWTATEQDCENAR